MNKLKQENAQIRDKMFLGLCHFLISGAAMWAILCFVLGYYVPAAVPVVYIILTVLNCAVKRGSAKPYRQVFMQMFLSMAMPMIFQVAMGGREESGLVMFWSFVPLVAISGYYRRQRSIFWLAFLISAMTALIIYDPAWSEGRIILHHGSIQSTLLALNIGSVALVIFSAALMFVRVQGRSRKKMHALQDRLESAHSLIAQRNDHLEKSMLYAQRIQRALMPEQTGVDDVFSERFLWIKQKEQVGGDSMWCVKKGDVVAMALVDCTGHGVPASLLSVMVHEILTNGFKQAGVEGPAALINFLYQRMEARLRNSDGLWNDNAEIAVVEFNRKDGSVCFAGTAMSMFVSGPNGIQRIKGAGPIFTAEQARALASQDQYVKLDPAGTSLYLYSDGVVDQFNQEQTERFGSSRLQDLIISVAHLPMDRQQECFVETMEDWKRNAMQTDDLTLTGLRLSPEFLGLSHQVKAA
ncbi:MAG: PP2C family protein-serine/threonine phosphatase [Flavobacteriales bacterium]